MNRGSSDDLLLLVGRPNSGKSSMIEDIYRAVDRRVYIFNKINLTRTIRLDKLYETIDTLLHRKSNRRKGMLQGRELVVFADDLNLPEANNFKYRPIISFLTFLLEKKGCYNYSTLEF